MKTKKKQKKLKRNATPQNNRRLPVDGQNCSKQKNKKSFYENLLNMLTPTDLIKNALCRSSKFDSTLKECDNKETPDTVLENLKSNEDIESSDLEDDVFLSPIKIPDKRPGSPSDEYLSPKLITRRKARISEKEKYDISSSKNLEHQGLHIDSEETSSSKDCPNEEKEKDVISSSKNLEHLGLHIDSEETSSSKDCPNEGLHIDSGETNSSKDCPNEVTKAYSILEYEITEFNDAENKNSKTKSSSTRLDDIYLAEFLRNILISVDNHNTLMTDKSRLENVLQIVKNWLMALLIPIPETSIQQDTPRQYARVDELISSVEGEFLRVAQVFKKTLVLKNKNWRHNMIPDIAKQIIKFTLNVLPLQNSSAASGEDNFEALRYIESLFMEENNMSDLSCEKRRSADDSYDAPSTSILLEMHDTYEFPNSDSKEISGDVEMHKKSVQKGSSKKTHSNPKILKSRKTKKEIELIKRVKEFPKTLPICDIIRKRR